MFLDIQVRIFSNECTANGTSEFRNQVLPHSSSITLDAQALAQGINEAIVLLTVISSAWVPEAFDVRHSIKNNLSRTELCPPVESPCHLAHVRHINATTM